MLNNRIEVLRNHIDSVLANMTDKFEQRCAYLHLYGVAQACALIALKRGEDAELATIAGMLHDFYTYKFSDLNNHAEKGAMLARETLNELKLTNTSENDLICKAIYNHSNKAYAHSSFDEILIDADVMQHCLYDVTKPVMQHEKIRFEQLVDEFGLNNRF